MNAVLKTAFAAAVLTSGCADPLTPSWLVDRVRVLGASVATEGDPSRATPHPGETAHVVWLLGFPSEALPSSWVFVACREAGTLRGAPACGERPFARFEGTSDAGRAPAFDVTLPAAFAPDGQLLVLGQICTSGAPSFDEATAVGSCRGADPGTTVDLRITVGSAANDNDSPVFTSDAFTFDGAPWGASESADPCADALVPAAAPGSAHRVEIAMPDEAREAYGASSRETIQLSHLVNAGELERQFSFVEPSAAPPLRVAVAWTAPAAGSASTPRFYFVARDDRGAAAWATRTICIR
ncbi:MAG TPA: hypothetical protein VJT73_17130 [Polyangiaceae bacterium]|nr:hypothetical protein [Polyangiaceae bacterium]